MTFSENGHCTEITEEQLYQELADTYQVFLLLFNNGTPLLAEYLASMSKLIRTATQPVTENPVIALQAARRYTTHLRAPIPPIYYPQEPLDQLVEAVLNELDYKDLVMKQAGADYLSYEKYTVLLVEKEKHLITEGVKQLGLEQTCGVIDSLREALPQPTLHSSA